MSLAWSEDLAVGHQLIDSQHRQIFAHFDAFLTACNRQQGREQLQELFGFLESYAASHFAAEEELMRERAYPAAAAHISQHRGFCLKFAELQRELASTGPTVELLVVTAKTMVYWLSEHIRHTDRAFATYLATAPAPPPPP